MKKTLLILSAIFLFFAGCKKDDDIEASKVEVKNEVIEEGSNYIKINAEYVYPEEMAAVSLYLSEQENMSDAKVYECKMEGKSFSVEANGLKENKKYHYCYEFDNGYEKKTVYGEQRSFKTLDITMPKVTTNDVTDITINSAKCGGNVTSDGGANVTARGVCWSTSQYPTISNSHTTDGNGTGNFTSNITGLTANTTYYVRAYATNEKGTSYGEQRSFTTLEEVGNYEYVDLGLPSGLKWATCNVGASSPEDYGDYFAWGEITTKSTYTEDNSLTYGLNKSQLQSQGYIDGSGNLTPSHDAATANWGGSWRMPTEDEMQELVDYCEWEWTQVNGVNGSKVIGPNGSYIFLPAAGDLRGTWLNYTGENGRCWSSTPYESNSNSAYCLSFFSGGPHVSWYDRSYGRSVRPVSE